jgi:hypothetical protein
MLPHKTENSARYERLAERSCLTRLAMFFQGRAEERFTGAEVACMMVKAVEVMGNPDSAYVIRETPPEVVESRMERIAPLLEGTKCL